MKPAKIPDILVKLSNIYKEDLYIIHSMYCIGGISSEEQSVGKCFCILTKDKSNDIKDYFGDIPIIYFKNIKKAKEALSTEKEYRYVQTYVDDKTRKELIDKKDEFLSVIKNIKEWQQFQFTEEQVKALIKDNERVTLFTNNPKVHNLEITKCVFPMITEKGLSTLTYTIFKTKNVKNTYTLITSMAHDYFMIYNFIHYIKLDKQSK